MANAQQEEKKFQSENNVEVVGILEDLEIRDKKNDGTPMQTKTGIPMMMATLKIGVAEGETHRVDMMAMKNYPSKPNEVSGQWKAMETLKNEYISRKDTEDSNSEHVGKKANIVSVRGNLDANVYVNQAGETVENLRIQGRFVNRADNTPAEGFGATFTLSGFVKGNPVPEMKGEEETGRYLVDFRVVDYQNKAIPVKLVAGQVEDEGEVINVGEWVEENIEMNQTMTFMGELVNRYIVKEIPRANQAVGKKVVDTKRDVVRENVIEGGVVPVHFDEADEETDKERVVFADQIKESVANYEQFKAEQEAASKNRASGGAAKKTKGFTGGKSSKSTGASKPVVNDGDLPF